MSGTIERIDTDEAASRLGVKRETIYAYVSRGLLGSERGVGGRTSTFDAAEVERLRRRRRLRPGHLEVAVSSGITEVSDGSVRYRGHALADLVASESSYEAVAELLWTGALADVGAWTVTEQAAAAVRRAASALPRNATPTDRMMAGVVAAGAIDPFRDDRTVEGVARVGRGLLRAVVDSLPIRVDGEDDRLARRLWGRLTSESAACWRLLDRALTVLADHGLATSTLAARLAASTRAGPHAALLAALGAVAGPLHGAASRRVHRLFVHAERDGGDAAIAEVMRRDGMLPGVGHVIHKTRDPRFGMLFGDVVGSDLDARRIDVVQHVVSRIVDHASGAPNIDLALGALTYATHMDIDAGELIFAVARTAGWLAHCLEEYGEDPLRFRAVGRYRASAG